MHDVRITLVLLVAAIGCRGRGGSDAKALSQAHSHVLSSVLYVPAI